MLKLTMQQAIKIRTLAIDLRDLERAREHVADLSISLQDAPDVSVMLPKALIAEQIEKRIAGTRADLAGLGIEIITGSA